MKAFMRDQGLPWNLDLAVGMGRVLNMDIKETAMKVSNSVVCLVSKSGGRKLCVCSGTIMESVHDAESGMFENIILTSATLVRCRSGEPSVAPDIRVDVYLSDSTSIIGEVVDFDFHYNVAVLNIRSDAPLLTPVLKRVHTSMPVVPKPVCDSGTFTLRRHDDSGVAASDLFPLHPEDKLILVGRSYKHSDLMIRRGMFSVDQCELDCQELLMATCKATHDFIGGPVINCAGQVVGMSFFHPSYTPFLPINIASKCLDHLKKHRRVHRPWIGVEVTNLFVSHIAVLERVITKFPRNSEGVIVEEVKKRSPAHYDGLKKNDVIVQFHGQAVKCILEFYELLWDNVGKTVEVIVLRERIGRRLKLLVTIDETTLNNYNRWPIHS